MESIISKGPWTWLAYLIFDVYAMAIFGSNCLDNESWYGVTVPTMVLMGVFGIWALFMVIFKMCDKYDSDW